MDTLTNLSVRLTKLRKSKNKYQKNIASSIGISLRMYQYYENGEKEITLNNLVKIADFFNVSLDYLVGRSDNPNYEPCNRSE